MTCDELKERLIDELRGAGDEAAVTAHLAGCATCRDEAASIREVWERLGRWPDARPDDGFRDRVLEALDAAEPVPPVHPSVWRASSLAARATAAVALLAIGMGLGVWITRPQAPQPEDPRAQFVLFLYDDPAVDAARTPEEMQATVDEYKAWAGGLAEAGNLVAGEKLTSERRMFGAVSSAGPVVPAGVSLGGYFVIRAGSPEEAAAIAAGCPHLVHGGAIELRRIDPV